MSAPDQSEDPQPSDISIVIPAWGAYAGKPLREALKSLRAQELPARLIVVDNASGEPLDDLDADEVVRSPSRLTLGAARNLGLERADTPYVLFWDADDLMLPGTLRLLRSRIGADRRLLAVAASIMEDEPRIPHRWPRRWVAPLTSTPRTFALCHSVWSTFPTTGSTIMRTGAIREAGGFGPGHGGDDWVLGVSLAYRGRVALDPTPGRLYRRHAGSLRRQQSSAKHLVRRATAVRTRIREDPGIPRWAKRLLPAIYVAQLLAVLVIRPIARSTRALSGRVGRERIGAGG